MTLKELKKGDFFTIKPIDNPTSSQVYIKGDYDRTYKAYECTKCSDIWSNGRLIAGSKTVYTDFTY